MEKDIRSKKIILVPFCLICQAFQAQGIVRFDWKSNIRPIVNELLKHEINIIQMPCPESQFNGYSIGLLRPPKGYSAYNTKEFRDLCKNLADSTIEMVKGIINADYELIAILGIEMSPSCAVNYQYSNNGMINQKGVFIEELSDLLIKNKIEIPLIGINRRHVKKSLNMLKELLNKDIQTSIF
jgi:predicted secreted protein